jgi:hypothetical protein
LAGVHGDAVGHEVRQSIAPPLIEVERRQVVVGRGHQRSAQIEPARQQLGFGDQMSANPGSLPQRIGGQRHHVQRVAERSVSQCAGEILRDEGDERRHLIDVHHLAEGDDLGPAEIALEQRTHRRPIRVGSLAHEDGRELQTWTAGADDLQLRILPVNQLSAPRTPQDRRLGAELV